MQSNDKIRKLLAEHDLRATKPRIAVLDILTKAKRPLSHSEVITKLGHTNWDQATIFRNLVKLKEAGIAPVVSSLDGIDRYMLKSDGNEAHHHPHFTCSDCGQLTCLPDEITNVETLSGPWANAVRQASVQLRGQCPDCL